MRFNPILSIILGAFLIIVAFVTLAGFLGAPNLNNKLITGIFLILAMLILLMGGFVATHFAKEYENKIYYGYKIRYAIYLGLILASLETIGTAHNLAGYKGIGTTIAYFILFPLITGIGGFIAKMTEKNNRQLFKSKHLTNGLSPIIAVIVGFVVATLCADLLLLIIGINPISTSYGIINFVVDATSILIGGFVTLFLVKEKKIQYGIYVALIVIIIKLFKLYTQFVQGIGINLSYIFLLGSVVGYLLFVIIGSYIGIKVAKHFKRNTNNH